MENRIKALLNAIVHPETEQPIVDAGIVELHADAQKIGVTLHFAKTRDPFALKIKSQVDALLHEHFPHHAVTVTIREGERRNPQPQPQVASGTARIGRIVAVASGKGGVGKSTVAANLAVALRDLGYRVGLLDADIYGPSQPKMFGVEGYQPDAVQIDGQDYIVPAVAQGIEIMSIGFFIRPTDPLLWRGAMAVNALKQLIHQTQWGEIDFLLADLPPGTGDIHLSIIHELQFDSAVIVSTPQQVAVADVVRGVEMFRNEQIAVPIAGIVENMAWFTPEELPDHKYYLFGRGGAARYAETSGVELIGQIPIIQSIMENADTGHPASGIDPRVADIYRNIARRIVDKLPKNGSQPVENRTIKGR